MKVMETTYKETQTSIQNTINKMITDMDIYHQHEIKNSDNTTRALASLKSMKEKFVVSDTIIGELKARIDTTEAMSFFIERSLPI